MTTHASIEACSKMIIRPFKLDRNKSPEEMIHVFGRTEYVDHEVLATMPTDGPDEGEMYFFCLNRYIPVSEQPVELAKHGLVPHYLAQIQINIDDPFFADDHPNAMQWGKYNYATFYRWGDGRGVGVGRDGDGWGGDWWFGGVRKSTQNSAIWFSTSIL